MDPSEPFIVACVDVGEADLNVCFHSDLLPDKDVLCIICYTALGALMDAYVLQPTGTFRVFRTNDETTTVEIDFKSISVGGGLRSLNLQKGTLILKSENDHIEPFAHIMPYFVGKGC